MKITKLLKWVLSLIFIIGFLLFINNYILNPKKTEKTDVTNKYVSFTIKKDMSKIENQYNLVVDDNYFDYSLDLKHSYNEKTKVTLTVDVNYEQIPFYIDTDSMMYYTFYINEDNPEINIPIKFKTNDIPIGINNLVFNINVGDKYNLVTTHNLIIGTSDNQFIKKSSLENSFKIDKETQGIFINNTIENNNIVSLGNVIEVSPNDTIKLPIVAGGYSDCDNYIYWLIVENKQILFSNQSNYYFNVDKGSFSLKEVSIQAPKEVGEYELYGCLISNPYKKVTSESISEIKRDFSKKIILKVK